MPAISPGGGVANQERVGTDLKLEGTVGGQPRRRIRQTSERDADRRMLARIKRDRARRGFATACKFGEQRRCSRRERLLHYLGH